MVALRRVQHQRSYAEVLILLAFAQASLVAAPAAGADGIDELYVGEVHTHGVPGNAATLIANGHAACQLFRAGMPTREVATSLAQQTGLTLTQAAVEASTAIEAYCPEQAWRFQNGM